MGLFDRPSLIAQDLRVVVSDDDLLPIGVDDKVCVVRGDDNLAIFLFRKIGIRSFTMNDLAPD
jgi:hypothetical protein